MVQILNNIIIVAIYMKALPLFNSLQRCLSVLCILKEVLSFGMSVLKVLKPF